MVRVVVVDRGHEGQRGHSGQTSCHGSKGHLVGLGDKNCFLQDSSNSKDFIVCLKHHIKNRKIIQLHIKKFSNSKLTLSK